MTACQLIAEQTQGTFIISQLNLTPRSSVNTRRPVIFNRWTMLKPTFSDDAKHKSFMRWPSHAKQKQRANSLKQHDPQGPGALCAFRAVAALSWNVADIYCPVSDCVATYAQENRIICISLGRGDTPAGLCVATVLMLLWLLGVFSIAFLIISGRYEWGGKKKKKN